MVPVNIRSDSERLALGNKISSLFVELPVAEPDPLRRYRLQTSASASHKGSGQAVGSRALIDFAAHAPPVLHSFLARSMYATRLFNLTITNVPGPPRPLYAFGSQAEEVWPIVPLAAEHAVGIAILSYAGRVCFCVNVDARHRSRPRGPAGRDRGLDRRARRSGGGGIGSLKPVSGLLTI